MKLLSLLSTYEIRQKAGFQFQASAPLKWAEGTTHVRVCVNNKTAVYQEDGHIVFFTYDLLYDEGDKSIIHVDSLANCHHLGDVRIVHIEHRRGNLILVFILCSHCDLIVLDQFNFRRAPLDQ